VPIHVSPSPIPGKLHDGIAQAIAQNDQLILDTGTHLTNPHSSEWIQVPATGLRITSESTSPRSLIKRPDNGMNGDGQYGLAFIPSPPTPAEIAAAKWKRGIDGQRVQSYTPGSDPCHPVPVFGAGQEFEYEIVVRGDIVIESVDLDCNMKNQPLDQEDPNHRWEHSAIVPPKYSDPSVIIEVDRTLSAPLLGVAGLMQRAGYPCFAVPNLGSAPAGEPRLAAATRRAAPFGSPTPEADAR
jgi:hypothetical protein